ncbi:hypothetical protein [Streptomyces sp. NPDC048142]|uniref:hypothetical protein n=1 Tax=Streptomyces sp. NPDC048142 TaxID=3365501 RepID=UPI003721CA83
MSVQMGWFGDIPPVLVVALLGALVGILPVIVAATGRAALDALHDRDGRALRLLTAISDWYYFSKPAVPEGKQPRKRPGVHRVQRRMVLERIVVTVARTCDAYRETGFHRTGQPIPAEQFDKAAGKHTYTGDLLLSLQADLRELSRYETGTAALKLPRRPTYGELLELRRTLSRLHKQPD